MKSRAWRSWRRDDRRPARARRQRRLRRRQLDAGGLGARRPGQEISGRRSSSTWAAASACPDRVDGRRIDLAKLDEALGRVKSALPGLELWLEPGRYFVANAGVLLARVTQIKVKSGIRYVGVATGMNSLIRPALYGAHHDIVNLTPLRRARESRGERRGSDLRERGLPRSRPAAARVQSGDVLLIANAGAYGRAMAPATTCVRRRKSSSSSSPGLRVAASLPGFVAGAAGLRVGPVPAATVPGGI